MALPMAVYFHRITVFALPVNILILPLLGNAVADGAAHADCIFVSTTVATIPAAVTALLLHLGVGLVHAVRIGGCGRFSCSRSASAAGCDFLRSAWNGGFARAARKSNRRDIGSVGLHGWR